MRYVLSYQINKHADNTDVTSKNMQRTESESFFILVLVGFGYEF